MLEGSLPASQKTGWRGYFLDLWIKTKTEMERAGAVPIFERTAALFWINHIYIYTAQTTWEAWKLMHNFAHCILRKLRSWSQSACSRRTWFGEKEIYSESFQVNPYFYKKHHELHVSLLHSKLLGLSASEQWKAVPVLPRFMSTAPEYRDKTNLCLDHQANMLTLLLGLLDLLLLRHCMKEINWH